MIKSTDETILVITPEPTSIMDAYSLIKIMDDNSFRKKINLVVNQTTSEQEGDNVSQRFETVVKKFLDFKIRTIGYVPYDIKVIRAVKSKKPFTILYPRSKVSRSVADIADILLKNKEEKKSSGVADFFNKLAGIFST